MEHTDVKIQQVVVMYLNADQISRPPARPLVSSCKGIMSCFSLCFLVYRDTMRGGRIAVGVHHACVCVVETTDPSDVRVVEIVTRELEKANPDKWGCV
jgi:hypothetical protein